MESASEKIQKISLNSLILIFRKIEEVREQIQSDLLCYLEKAPSTFEWSPDMVCSIVVENFKELLPPSEENS